MGWLYAMAALGVMAVLTPIVIWIFQGNARPRGGGLGPTLGDLNAFFDPSRRNIEAVKEQRSITRRKMRLTDANLRRVQRLEQKAALARS